MGKVRKNLVDIVNNSTYSHYYNLLSLISKSLFEWEGLPKSVNERYLEYCLFNFGKAVFFEDNKLGTLCLKADPVNLYNVYREPTEIRAVGENGYQKCLKADECVLIRNNADAIPTREAIELFAYRLYDTQRSADTNIFMQKVPYIAVCEENKVLTLKNLFAKVNANEPVIYGVKNGLNLEDIKVLPTKAEYVANDLMDYKNIIWNEAMSFLGINNIQIDKKERLTTSEAEGNDEQINALAFNMLNTRLEACKEIKEKFGIDVKVKFRDYEKIVKGCNKDVSRDTDDADTTTAS